MKGEGLAHPDAAAFAFIGTQMLVFRSPAVRVPHLIDLERCGVIQAGPFVISRAGEPLAVAVSLADEPECPGLELKGLRELFGILPQPDM